MQRLSPMDASFLHAENDSTHPNVNLVSVFEGPPPSHDEVTRLVASKLDQVPRYRHKLKFLPLGLGQPVWIDDPEFNLDFHIRRTALPAPGGLAELESFAAHLCNLRMDRGRPLWEMWVIEGLADGQWALLWRMHHAMVDGASATNLIGTILSASPDAPATNPTPWHPETEPNAFQIAIESAMGALSPLERIAAVPVALRNVADLAVRTRAVVRSAATLGRSVVEKGSSSLSGPVGPNRRWTTARATLADVKTVRGALGGTVNDIVLTVITQGFRDLLLGRGEQVPVDRVIRSGVPVSTRVPGAAGPVDNQVSLVTVDLPVGLADPVARLADIRRQMDHVKETKGALAAAAMTDLAGFATPMLFALGARLALQNLAFGVLDTGCTNVPGPQHPLYFNGRRMERVLPIVPLGSGVRVGVAIFSYDGGLDFGVSGDFSTFPDVAVLARGIEKGMAELLALCSAGQASNPSARM